ncbi:zinc-binding alcohol dehydrogenase family protein [Branchiibius sp. NY16-3462-2]|uniref:quinone oxidoreductase family protein n=1 Tax=Branchiibius sp. NY16-3462-2 TaxID=1807500 RepID=UPI0007942865|nr:zinc-binding alcohol dehydrogenase family protein [Branchiibius sp. NY16-3462-2]KYH43468.1 quinone oxidoreductase [Branchiibius sp. NY16-3462-2]
MYAAVVTSFDQPPHYQEIPEPVAGPGELVVDVVAAALHHRVRSQADGSHYSSDGTLPLVPGIDAVIRDADGRLRFVLQGDGAPGTMAQRTVIEERRSVVLPDGIDPAQVAAVMNPAMSSWVALRRRIDFQPGMSVLVTGATGNSGRAAIQVAKRFGAGQVIAAGRNPAALEALRALGADEICLLEDLSPAADVDVVIDYLWGEVAAKGMVDLVSHRRDRSAPLTWIQIGSMVGRSADIPSAALRAARLSIVGSGIGSVPGADYLAELPGIASAAAEFDIRPRVTPLREVETAWSESIAPDERIVFAP